MANITRRKFMQYTGAAGLAAPFMMQNAFGSNDSNAKNPICIFSKHLQWLDFEDLGKYVRDVGYDGVDLTVRGGGHVSPEDAEKVLPSALEKIRKSGALVPMMVTDIADADHPHTEPILKTAGANGIGYYRMDYIKYDRSKPIAQHLEHVRPHVARLAAMNKKYGIHGAYQNHHGSRIGASVWDWWYIIKDMDPKWIGFQFDVRHAVVEGGHSWINDFGVVKDFVKCSVIKDFHWKQRGDGTWKAQSVPLGEGMVDFDKYLGMYKDFGISGPISLHFEYPIIEQDASKLTKKEKMQFARKVLAKDLEKLREMLQKAGV